MTQLLQQAFDEASHLPPDEQDTFAAWMLAELRSEQRWQELFARSQDLLAKMADEALAEHRAGKTLPLDPDIRLPPNRAPALETYQKSRSLSAAASNTLLGHYHQPTTVKGRM